MQAARTGWLVRSFNLIVRAQLRFLWRARGSMLSALLGMTIGVASITGVHLLSAQIAHQVRNQAQPLGGVDLYLQRQGQTLTDDDYFRLREGWRAGSQPSIAAMFPLLEGAVELADQTLLLVSSDPLAVGVSFAAGASDPQRSETQTADNSAPSLGFETYLAVNSVYLPSSLSDYATLGERITLGDAQVQVLGFSAPEGVVLADLPTARAVLNTQALSRIGVLLTDEARAVGGWPRVRHVVDRLFPGAVQMRAAPMLKGLAETAGVGGWAQVPAANASPTVQLLQSVLFNVAALSMLALVVAWLLTYQVACHALGRRQAMFARLQSLGVPKSRLRRLTLIEGGVLGLLATLLGILLGVWLANVLSALVQGNDFSWALGIERFVVLKALVSGIGVAGLSYALAARDELFDNKASGAQLPRQAAGKAGWLWFAGLATVFLVGLLVPTSGLSGAFASILCCALLLIVFLPRLAAVAWRVTLVPEGSTTTAPVAPMTLLGRRQVLVGQELRLGISALALALATALGISVMVDSFRGAFVDMLDRRLADDAVLVLHDPASEPARRELQQITADLTTTMLWRGVVPIESKGLTGRMEFAESFSGLLLRFVPQADAERAASLTNAVFVNESFARLQNLQVGDALSISGRAGAAEALLAGIFTDYGEVRPRLLGDASLVQQLHGGQPLTEAYVNTVNIAALRAAMTVWIDDGRLQLRDQSQVRSRSLQIFEQTFVITRALTWLALLVAVVALANALAAHSLQLAGTDRQLQVLGVSAVAARRLRLSRTFYAAGLALLLALPLGFAIAALLCGVVNPRAFGWSFPMQVTFSGVAWPMLGGMLGGALASGLGLWLARRQSAVARKKAGVGRPAVASLLAIFLIGCSDASEVQSAANQVDAAPTLRVGTVLGGAVEGFARATVVREFEFPQDHGAHPSFRSEWWYLTCPLQGAAGEFGVQFTLFRQGLSGSHQLRAQGEQDPITTQWRNGQIYMAHAALTSVADGEHLEASRFARGHPRLAGVTVEPFAAWLENWRLNGVGSADGLTAPNAFELNVVTQNFAIDLQLQARKPIVLQGDRGLSYKGSREASYYYSLPRLDVTGQVALGGSAVAPAEQQAVTGACWFDREWSTSVLADGLVGWDWFALQFDDQTELMLFQLRTQGDVALDSQHDRFARVQGKAVAADGSALSLIPGDLRFEPLRYWRDEQGIDWPVEWQIGVADRQLRVQAALDDQRMRETLAYWEGLVWVYDGNKRVGQGYLEMTGYSGRY